MKGRLPILGQPVRTSARRAPGGRYALGVTWPTTTVHLSVREPAARLRVRRLRRARGRRAGHDVAQDIRRTDAGLAVTWSDAHASVYAYPDLRALCRCAACTGGH